MALTETTLSSACAAADASIVVASASGFAAGYYVRMNEEICQVAKAYVSGTTIPLMRGVGGTVAIDHPVTQAVEVGAASDTEWGTQAAQTSAQFPIAGVARVTRTYSASGAIELPPPGSDGFAILNAVSTTVLAMTLALPSKAADGTRLRIASRNGTGAHTVTIAGRLNGAPSGNYTIITAPASPFMVELHALDSFWYVCSGPAWTGTVTLITVGVS